jgi:hypothetical protein
MAAADLQSKNFLHFVSNWAETYKRSAFVLCWIHINTCNRLLEFFWITKLLKRQFPSCVSSRVSQQVVWSWLELKPICIGYPSELCEVGWNLNVPKFHGYQNIWTPHKKWWKYSGLILKTLSLHKAANIMMSSQTYFSKSAKSPSYMYLLVYENGYLAKNMQHATSRSMLLI